MKTTLTKKIDYVPNFKILNSVNFTLVYKIKDKNLIYIVILGKGLFIRNQDIKLFDSMKNNIFDFKMNKDFVMKEIR